MSQNNWWWPTAFSSWAPNDDGPEDQAWKRVYASGQLTMAGETAACEEEFAYYHDRRHAIMVNSGSSANLVATAALAIEEYDFDTVNVPAIAWNTTYAGFAHVYGSYFKVMDVGDDWNALPTEYIRGAPIVACSVLGVPANLTKLRDICNKDKQPLFEDNCESIGAVDTSGMKTGTMGDVSTLSFFYSHQISAVEGGMILTDNNKLAELCRLLRNHGNAGWGESDIAAQYNFQIFGYNLRPLECHAAVAREQLKKLDESIEARRWNSMYFRDQTFRLPILHQQVPQRAKPSPFALAFECETNAIRNQLAVKLKRVGIDCRLPTGGSFTKHTYGATWSDQPTPRADEIHDRGLFLGNPPWEDAEGVDKIVKYIEDFLGTR
jgi:CDP-6-deoxy-D-xylo-4-hexulose-3-dehydrase